MCQDPRLTLCYGILPSLTLSTGVISTLQLFSQALSSKVANCRGSAKVKAKAWAGTLPCKEMVAVAAIAHLENQCMHGRGLVFSSQWRRSD